MITQHIIGNVVAWDPALYTCVGVRAHTTYVNMNTHTHKYIGERERKEKREGEFVDKIRINTGEPRGVFCVDKTLLDLI